VAQLGDQRCLLELRYGAEDLADHLGGRPGVAEEVRRIYRHQFDVAFAQQRVASQLNHKIAGEAAGVLHQHRGDAMLGAAGQQGDESGAAVHRVGAANQPVLPLLPIIATLHNIRDLCGLRRATK
jgi:hypothetical protein